MPIFKVRLVTGSVILVTSATNTAATPVAITTITQFGQALTNQGAVIVTDNNNIQYALSATSIQAVVPAGTDPNFFSQATPSLAL